MAARKHLTHDEKTRNRIRTSQLLNRLQDNAFGKIELTSGQLKSIEILLKKALPDLSAVQLDVEHSGNLAITKIELVAPDDNSAS